MHTNRKLFELATKNSQRNAAENFLSSLSDELKLILEKAGVVYYPELSEIFSPIIHQANELHELNGMSKVGARTLMTASKEKAFASFFKWASELPEGECVLVMGGGNGVSFNGTGSWISILPGYLVTVSEAVAAFRALSPHGMEQVAIALRSSSHAVVMETCGGYLPDEPSAIEVVYELTSW